MTLGEKQFLILDNFREERIKGFLSFFSNFRNTVRLTEQFSLWNADDKTLDNYSSSPHPLQEFRQHDARNF